MSLDEQVYRASGKAFDLLIKAARKIAPDNADMQRAFIADCIVQLQNDLRNT